jgi:hypothetical protein
MASPTTTPQASGGAKWGLAIVLAVAVFVARMVWLVAVSGSGGLGLAADEAHYWDWARHLDWSYPTKGPGVAAAIWASTQAFGHVEWAVRLPAALSGSIALLAVYGLTLALTGGRGRAALIAAALFALVPAFQVTSLVMTIDGPYVACWALAAWAGLVWMRRLERHRPTLGPAAAFGLALGVGFLFKYTIALLLVSMVVALVVRRGEVSWRRAVVSVAAMVMVAGVCALPVVVWNAREGWPTVAHLLGHLGAPGGDLPVREGQGKSWTILWMLEFVGAQFGIVGPMLVLMGLAAVGVGRELRLKRNDAEGVPGVVGGVWCLAAAGPILLMYLGVSLVTDAEANWPIAGYVTLVALIGARTPEELHRLRRQVTHWRSLDKPRPRAGILRKRPESWFQILLHWSVGYGLVCAIGIATLAIPAVRNAEALRTRGALQRLQSGERLTELLLRVIEERGLEPGATLIIAGRYTAASRAAYGLHGALAGDTPIVTSAASLMGDRKSSYDYWPSTDPRALEARERPVVLIGGSRARKWTNRFVFDRVEPALEARDERFGMIWVGYGFGSARHEATP